MIDVSSWQTGINVTTTGAQIVVAKATESTNYVNPDCDRVVQQALAAGQGVGVYHFANTANSPQAEAECFNRNTEGYIGRGIVPILDWEPSQPWNVEWAAQWVDAVRARWDTIPIIYMNQSTENSYDWSPLVQRNVGLWVAAYTLGYTPIYGFNPPSRQPVLQNWPFAVAWQYTSSGRVDGWSGNLDLSVVYGDLETWLRVLPAADPDGTAEPTPAPEPAPAPQPSDGSCGPDCRVIQSGQYVSMFWPDWWNVTVPSGNPSLVFPAIPSATTAAPPPTAGPARTSCRAATTCPASRSGSASAGPSSPDTGAATRRSSIRARSSTTSPSGPASTTGAGPHCFKEIHHD